jgi:hypothetical protein
MAMFSIPHVFKANAVQVFDGCFGTNKDANEMQENIVTDHVISVNSS